MACNWRCLCPGQPVPLSTTLPWWKLALSVCLSHACNLSSDVIASCRQAMACNWRCLCPGQPVPLSTIFFGRDLRIQHVDIVKKVHLFLLCLAQAVLVFQLWLIASCRQALACNWGGQGQIQGKVGMSWKQAHLSKTSKQLWPGLSLPPLLTKNLANVPPAVSSLYVQKSLQELPISHKC